MKKLPVWKLTIKADDSGVDYVALVDFPAIERNFEAFSKEKSVFKVQDEKKKILSGPLMIADMPIYRRSPDKGEYYAVFDKETIEQIAQRYFKNKFNTNVNLMHDEGRKVEGIYQYESFIIDRNRGVMPPKGFEDLTDGSWFGSFKVDNNEVWDKFIETGELKGFSVEGFFEQEKISDPSSPEEDLLKQILEILEK